jgi:3',5'-cyclic AMP phosphodiesterase CpdA
MLKKIKEKESNNKKFSFVVIGDNRDGDDIFKKIIKKINQTKIDFIINNGDLVSHGFEYEYKKYLEIIKKSKIPIISCIGNHEIPFYGSKSNFRKYIGKPYFSFSYKNAYFIFLDNANKERVSYKQMKWLKKELKKSKKFKHKFVFLHVPLYDPRKGYLKKGHSMKDKSNAKELNKLFDKYKIDMIFCSHIHTFIQGYWRKTPFVITGGAGAPNGRDEGFFHYIKVKINKKNIKYKLFQLN